MAPHHLLLILDGYGIADDPSVSAIEQARKPYLDHLFATYPHGTLEASGRAVGLPEGQMGNSEVGHLNLGAGRIVYQDITRIDVAIEDGSFYRNEALCAAAEHARRNQKRLHLLGLVSDGGVHSHLRHLVALLELARREELAADQVWIHVFTDGRDTDPRAGKRYVREIGEQARQLGVGRIATIMGRYFAMDRDNRWPRTKHAYDVLTASSRADFAADVFEDPEEALAASYEKGITDEFVEPVRISGAPPIRDGDAVVFFNFRADRARQLTRAFTDPSFDAFDRGTEESRPLDVHFVTFTPYDETFDLSIAFPKDDLIGTMGEVISELGLSQLRAAETEKYPHVTYFYSGGREKAFPREDRVLVPSPQVATYDLEPEMSAHELAAQVASFIRENRPNYIVLNFANSDMVGHTGVFEAAVRAVEAVDQATRVVIEAALAARYSVQLIADHGNADKMRNPDGSPHTAHTTALVPHIIMKEGFSGPVRHGKLGDVAPTSLALMGLDPPPEMDGEVLFE